MTAEELAKIMKHFPPELPELYSDLFTPVIVKNSRDKFEMIIQEKNIVEKLDQLDDLVAQKTGFSVSMEAFDFNPTDPEVVKQAIISQAKRQEIETLQQMLDVLRERNAQMEERNTMLKERLSRAHEEIEETKRLFD